MTKLCYFSIIIPVYNAENYLDRCVESILDQKFQDYELILLNVKRICRNSFWNCKGIRKIIFPKTLEDIGYNEKSDVRLMIEKFVDENPDAVASLLRNWLNEDWE